MGNYVQCSYTVNIFYVFELQYIFVAD